MIKAISILIFLFSFQANVFASSNQENVSFLELPVFNVQLQNIVNQFPSWRYVRTNVHKKTVVYEFQYEDGFSLKIVIEKRNADLPAFKRTNVANISFQGKLPKGKGYELPTERLMNAFIKNASRYDKEIEVSLLKLKDMSHNDDNSQQTSKQMMFIYAQFLILSLLLFVIVFMIVFISISYSKDVKKFFNITNAKSVIFYLGLFTAAFLLRILVPHLDILHEHGRSFQTISMVINPSAHYSPYGYGYAVFYFLPNLVIGSPIKTIIVTNCMLGSISAFLLVPMVNNLFGREDVGKLAGIIMAVWPALIRVSASETMYPVALFFSLLAFAAWIYALRYRNVFSFILAASALAYAVQVRPDVIVWAVMFPLVLPVLKIDFFTLIKNKSFLISFLILSVSLSIFFMHIYSDITNPSYRDEISYTLKYFFNLITWDYHLFANTAWTLPAQWLFLLLGVLGLYKRNPKVLAAIGGTFITYFILIVPGVHCIGGALRLETMLQPLYIILISYGIIWVADSVKIKGLTYQTIVVVLSIVAIASCAVCFASVREVFDIQREEEFLEKNLKEIPSHCLLVIPDAYMNGGKVVTSFPYWKYNGQTITIKQYKVSKYSSNQCAYFYKSLSCYWNVSENNAYAMQPECLNFINTHKLKMLTSEIVTAEHHCQYYDYQTDTPEIGFYEIQNDELANNTMKIRRKSDNNDFRYNDFQIPIAVKLFILVGLLIVLIFIERVRK